MRFRLPKLSREERTEELEGYEEEALKAIEDAKKRKEILKSREERKFGRRVLKEYSVEEHGELIEYEPPRGWRIVEDYWVLEPYCKVFIIFNEEEQEYRYVVAEPRLSPIEVEIYGEINLILRDKLEKDVDGKLSREEILKEKFDEVVREVGFDLDDRSYYKILYYVTRDFLFYGRITALMLDKMLEDISCNGYRKPIYVFHRN
ncbi:MAG: secretion system protein E, partial [Archaeoglobaceae archaeon]